MDYDLLGDARNGLDVIRELGIAEQSILVTSYYDEDVVRRSCLDMGVHMVPKTLAAAVLLHVDGMEVQEGKTKAQVRRSAC